LNTSQEKKREIISLAPDGRAPQAQPKWRRDFPIDVEQDNYVARRDFTKFMVLTSLAFVAGQLWILLQNFFRLRRGDLPVQQIARLSGMAVGESVTFSYPEAHDSCVLVRTGEQHFIAYSQKCTHLSCAVVPQPEKNCFLCPCHEGKFDLHTGRPIAGPPRRPLPRIKLEILGDTIYATGVEVSMV
jgi:nitrite reductase/ring-hydroxylating ferredoxin subunit